VCCLAELLIHIEGMCSVEKRKICRDRRDRSEGQEAGTGGRIARAAHIIVTFRKQEGRCGRSGCTRRTAGPTPATPLHEALTTRSISRVAAACRLAFFAPPNDECRFQDLRWKSIRSTQGTKCRFRDSPPGNVLYGFTLFDTFSWPLFYSCFDGFLSSCP
jgi:hypothetical protein